MAQTNSATREQVAILFSDISGFSAMPPALLPHFVSQVMHSLAEEVSHFKPKVKNTWGDAIFLVFATAQEAANCALKLRDVFRNTDWTERGMPSDLKMRFALHNAYATILEDPLTGLQNAYGQHINQAARLEPVGVPNEIFATHEFKVALETHPSTLFAFDEVGKMALAKDWGETMVYRLRRSTDQSLSAQQLLSLRRSGMSLEQLMPMAAAIVKRDKGKPSEAIDLLKYADGVLLRGSIFRRDWKIELWYDTALLGSEEIVIERLEWSYELVNIGLNSVTYPLQLISAPDLEGQGGFKSMNKLLDDGSELSVLPSALVASNNAEAFAQRRQDIELESRGRYRLEMRYEQKWPVNRKHPTVHNCFAPRETTFGVNRLEINATVKKLGVLFGMANIQPTHHGADRFSFNIPSPIVQHQAIELLLEF
jgi:class 3 adenylate cyclase